MASGLNVYWLLFSDRKTGSSRMHGFLVDEYLKKVGINSSILLSPAQPLWDLPWDETDLELIAYYVRGGIVFLQKLAGPRTERLVRRLKQDGTFTVYGMGDLIPENRIPHLCDAVVCSSEDLADHYRSEGCQHVVYIPDPVERWSPPERANITRPVSRGLKACWVGSSNNWAPFESVVRMFREEEFRDIELISISDHPDATLPWSEETVHRVVPECDLAVLPTGDDLKFRVKSNNRALLFMAHGVPLVASPLRSYKEVIKHEWSGYLAEDLDGFRSAVRELRSPEKRKFIASNAYSSIEGRYDVDSFGERWKAFFEALIASGCPQASAEPGGLRHTSGKDDGVLKARADLLVAQTTIRCGQINLPRRLVARNLSTIVTRPELHKEVAEVIRGRPKSFFLRWFATS